MKRGTAKAPGQHPINPPRPWVPLYNAEERRIGRARLAADETLEYEVDDAEAERLLSTGFTGGLSLGGEKPDGSDVPPAGG